MASAIAVFVNGKIPGLFFKGLTKKKKFTGRTKNGMIKDIDEAVIEYIKKRNGTYLFTYFFFRKKWSFWHPTGLNYFRSVTIEFCCFFSNAFYILRKL